MQHAVKTPKGVGLYGFFIPALYIRVDITTPRLLPTQDSWYSQLGESLSQFGRRFKRKTPKHISVFNKRTIC
jgi:hypothetical protein